MNDSFTKTQSIIFEKALSGLRKSEMQGWQRRGNSSYKMLVIAALIVALPSHTLYYVAPFAAFIYGIIRRLISVRKTVSIYCIFTAFTFVSYLLNYVLSESTNWVGYFWATITYAPFLLLFSISSSFLIDNEINNKVVKFIILFAVVQVATCFFQIFSGAIWDNISGTFGLQDMFNSDATTVAQMMFAVNMLTIAAFLYTYLKRMLVKVVLILIFFAVAASQSGHATIFFILSFGSVYLLEINLKRFVIGSLGIALFYFAVAFYFPETVELGSSWYSQLFEIDFPKIEIVEVFFKDILNAKTFLLGTGVGQFSSRAALISSGDYIQASLPSFLTGQSSFYKHSFLPVFDILYRGVPFYSGSAIPSPTFSALSILAEFGVVFFVVIVIRLLLEYIKNKKLMRTQNDEQKMLAKFLNFQIVFLVMCCCIENYAEYVQAILLPLLLYIIAKARIKFLSEEAKSKPI